MPEEASLDIDPLELSQLYYCACVVIHWIFHFCRNDDLEKMEDDDNSQEIKESQEEVKDGQEEAEESQEETKDSQEDVKESGKEIKDNQNVTELEKTEAIKTGGKANTRRETKKDGSDDQPTGKVASYY